jgi:hypothetical protein
MRKAIFITGSSSPNLNELQSYLDKGYEIVSVTAQMASSTGQYSSTYYGGFLVILKK